MVVEQDPVALAGRIVADFDKRRAGLGWQPAAPALSKRLSARTADIEHEYAHTHEHNHTLSHEKEHHHE
jgi:carbon-monoxide dehydrogenase catalytic subunit